MTEATTRDVPSRPLRDLIARATEEGRDLEGNVGAFGEAVQRVAGGFEAEVEPLRLSDDEYQQVAFDCGLTGLLDMAERMATTLEEASTVA